MELGCALEKPLLALDWATVNSLSAFRSIVFRRIDQRRNLVGFHLPRWNRLQHKIKVHPSVSKRSPKPLPTHFSIVDHRHPVVDWFQQCIRSRRDDRERIKLAAVVPISPAVP